MRGRGWWCWRGESTGESPPPKFSSHPSLVADTSSGSTATTLVTLLWETSPTATDKMFSLPGCSSTPTDLFTGTSTLTVLLFSKVQIIFSSKDQICFSSKLETLDIRAEDTFTSQHFGDWRADTKLCDIEDAFDTIHHNDCDWKIVDPKPSIIP